MTEQQEPQVIAFPDSTELRQRDTAQVAHGLKIVVRQAVDDLNAFLALSDEAIAANADRSPELFLKRAKFNIGNVKMVLEGEWTRDDG